MPRNSPKYAQNFFQKSPRKKARARPSAPSAQQGAARAWPSARPGRAPRGQRTPVCGQFVRAHTAHGHPARTRAPRCAAGSPNSGIGPRMDPMFSETLVMRADGPRRVLDPEEGEI
ncbi:hypothetical protein L484_026275 [Morus notabilis]|uniref:Uncharacterized protein n=1 Tax=Morus notabilis TaxID=981085 RepID=W9RV17_9ROSA|nr:hypothetical protein L484_026275 [Morus notabilis]